MGVSNYRVEFKDSENVQVINILRKMLITGVRYFFIVGNFLSILKVRKL